MAKKKTVYKVVPIWPSTYEKLKKLKFRLDKPFTVLVDEMVDFYIEHHVRKQSAKKKTK